MGPLGTNRTVQYLTVWYHRVPTGPFGTIQDHMEPFGTVRGHKGPYGTIRDNTGPFRSIQDHAGLDGTIQNHRDHTEDLYHTEYATACMLLHARRYLGSKQVVRFNMFEPALLPIFK